MRSLNLIFKRIGLTALLVILCMAMVYAIACDNLDGVNGFDAVKVETPETESRIQMVKARGKLNCATQTDLPGFGYLDRLGEPRGFDVDLCRAVAAAVFGDPEAVEFKHVAYAERASLLKSGEIDILARTTTWSVAKEAQWGDFTAVMFYDGQGFMVRKTLGVDSALALDGATVCVPAGTGTQQNLTDYFNQNGMRLEMVSYKETADTYQAYERGECDAATIDKSQLAAARSAFEDPDAHIILPETISKEPLAPMVPSGDAKWTTLVRMVFYVLINAEELGVTQDNAEAMRNSEDILIRRMLGTEGSFGQGELGLKPDFAVDVLKAVGNYGEIYDRYLGPEGEAFTLPRGLNNLWNNGGILYAPPIT